MSVSHSVNETPGYKCSTNFTEVVIELQLMYNRSTVSELSHVLRFNEAFRSGSATFTTRVSHNELNANEMLEDKSEW
jgi:hypothetical protein